MNIIDYVIIGLIAVSVLIGLYRGFISSVLNTGGCLISLLAAFKLGPMLAQTIQSNPELQRTLLTYTDASNRVGDLATSVTKVSTLSADGISQIVTKVHLPEPLSSLLQSNLTHQVYGDTATTVSEYVSATVLSACINVICFVVCFILVFLGLSLLVNLIRAVFRLPVLKQLDSLAGGAFGLVRGGLICFVLFALVPLVQTMVPLDMVNELLETSTLAPLFNNGNLVQFIMSGKFL